MPLADTSQTTRTKLIAGKELAKFQRLNPYSPQGGRYNFSHAQLLLEIEGRVVGGCCSENSVSIVDTYTVTYLGNENTGGDPPTDSLSPYNKNASVTVLNTNTLTYTGYHFTEWNTAANGSGTSYAVGGSFTIVANTTFYAQWESDSTTYTVLYNGNTGEGSLTDTLSPYTYNASVTVLGNDGVTPFTKKDNSFAGWNTSANGDGTPYNGGNQFNINANTILYAQWTPIVETLFTVVYNGNEETGGSVPIDTMTYLSGAVVTVLDNTGNLVKTDYLFVGWDDGTGITILVGATFSINANTILYAKWVPALSVFYDGNGGTGAAPIDSKIPYGQGEVVDVLGRGDLENGVLSFDGWNTQSNGSGTSYEPGDMFTITANTTLYAQWVST